MRASGKSETTLPASFRRCVVVIRDVRCALGGTYFLPGRRGAHLSAYAVSTALPWACESTDTGLTGRGVVWSVVRQTSPHRSTSTHTSTHMDTTLLLCAHATQPPKADNAGKHTQTNTRIVITFFTFHYSDVDQVCLSSVFFSLYYLRARQEYHAS